MPIAAAVSTQFASLAWKSLGPYLWITFAIYSQSCNTILRSTTYCDTMPSLSVAWFLGVSESSRQSIPEQTWQIVRRESFKSRMSWKPLSRTRRWKESVCVIMRLAILMLSLRPKQINRRLIPKGIQLIAYIRLLVEEVLTIDSPEGALALQTYFALKFK